ncbi:acetolactate synthase 2 small subunit [Psychrobium sp. nBUS_13]|uniref:acetolactate synthase 2 small subunit n=1 Tax=Psychrobium sp. nBUS_13 TaxID=3395319 RepID=UPI003EBA1F4B
MSLAQHQLKLVVNQSPEVLERVLRVVRHRGYQIDQLNWRHEDGELILTVSSQRALHLLTNQLAKLVDVKDVTELNMMQTSKSA